MGVALDGRRCRRHVSHHRDPRIAHRLHRSDALPAWMVGGVEPLGNGPRGRPIGLAGKPTHRVPGDRVGAAWAGRRRSPVSILASWPDAGQAARRRCKADNGEIRTGETRMTRITRRAAIGLLAAGGVLLGVGAAGGFLLRDALKSFSGNGMMGEGMMGSASQADMSSYMNLFDRHKEIRRMVEVIEGGVRTTTESDSPDLVGQLQAHVSSMYSHVNQQAEVTCMSSSLPTLFRNSGGYQRELTLTTKGVVVTETSNDPRLTSAIRQHAEEVSGFVRDGMPAMMRGTMSR